MTHLKRNAGFLMVLILALCALACSSDQVINSLEMAVSAVSAALPLVGPSAGMPPALVSEIETYLGATSQAIGQAADILDGPGTDGAKAAAIGAAFAGIAVPVVPPKYQGIAAAVQQVAVMVSRFIASLPPAVQGPAVASKLSFMPEATKSTKHTKLSESQRKRLAEIKAKAKAAKAAVKKE